MITSEELQKILELHGKWLRGEDGGTRANLHDADLSRANLHDANLRGANLSGTNLRKADLSRANLHDADLHDADLHDADLRWTDLRRANLHDANLSGTNLRYTDLRGNDLRGADLRGADLSGADLSGANLWHCHFCKWQVFLTSETLRIGCQRYSWNHCVSEGEKIAEEYNVLAEWKLFFPVLQAAHNMLIARKNKG